MNRRRAATNLLACGAIFTAVVLFLSWEGKGTWLLIYGVAIPLLPFVVLAGAARSERFMVRHLYRLAVFFALIIGGPTLATYILTVTYSGGGANFAVGCYYVLIPFAMPLALVLGLALAAESQPLTRNR